MIRAMWTAATGMTAQQLNVDTIAHNLANVNTNAFKRSRAEFADLLYQIQRLPGTNASNVGVFPVGVQIGAGVRPITVAKEWLQGNMRQTNNELDLAIDGPGFFQVARPDGTIMYTRSGSFKRDNVGNLVTGDGDQLTPVITIPSGALKLDIGQDGTVSVLLPGSRRLRRWGRSSWCASTTPRGWCRWGITSFSTVSHPVLLYRERADSRQGSGRCSKGFGKLQRQSR